MTRRPFGDWLQQELRHRGWTQTAFARRLPGERTIHSKQSHVSKWLRNERRPSPHSCALIASALDLSLDELLAHAGYRDEDLLGSRTNAAASRPAALAGGPAAVDVVISPTPAENSGVHQRLISLIQETPEEQLAHLVPLFEWIRRNSQHAVG